MGFLDFLKDVSKGLTSTVLGNIPIVGSAAATQLNKLYRKGGLVGYKTGGIVKIPIAMGSNMFYPMPQQQYKMGGKVKTKRRKAKK